MIIREARDLPNEGGIIQAVKRLLKRLWFGAPYVLKELPSNMTNACLPDSLHCHRDHCECKSSPLVYILLHNWSDLHSEFGNMNFYTASKPGCDYMGVFTVHTAQSTRSKLCLAIVSLQYSFIQLSPTSTITGLIVKTMCRKEEAG